MLLMKYGTFIKTQLMDLSNKCNTLTFYLIR